MAEEQKSSIEIIDYTDELKEKFKELNYEWIIKLFKPEQHDIEVLSNPEHFILENGGHIFFAKQNEEIIGTAALIRVDNTTFELSKMGVTEKARGTGVGNLLIQHCINFATANHIKSLILYSSTVLGPAIHLYEKYGFYEVPLEGAQHKRANIKMKKDL
ncbi:MAG: GNAT family N-acetyltransferase [Chitinophagaceae bacterium]|nr:GNAT family N-acetyltransferase [Chitinophagaceae bacterium]